MKMSLHKTMIVVFMISFRATLFAQPCTHDSFTGLYIGQYKSKVEYLRDNRIKFVLYQAQCCRLKKRQNKLLVDSVPSDRNIEVYDIRWPYCDSETFRAFRREKTCGYRERRNKDDKPRKRRGKLRTNGYFPMKEIHINTQKTMPVVRFGDCSHFEDIALEGMKLAEWPIGKYSPAQWTIEILTTMQVRVHHLITVYLAICDHFNICVVVAKSGGISEFRQKKIFRMFTNEAISNIDHVVILAMKHENWLVEENRPLLQIRSLKISRVGVSTAVNNSIDIASMCVRHVCNITGKPLILNTRPCNHKERDGGKYYYRNSFGNCTQCRCYNEYSICNSFSGVECLSEYCFEIQSEKYPNVLYRRTSKGNRTVAECNGGTLSRDCLSKNGEAIWGQEQSDNCSDRGDNYCNKIRSGINQNLVYNKTLEGTIAILNCHSGNLSRLCEPTRWKSKWGQERNNNCSYRGDNYCNKIRSGINQNLVYNKTLEGTIAILNCHSGNLSRMCESLGNTSTWSQEQNNSCSDRGGNYCNESRSGIDQNFVYNKTLEGIVVKLNCYKGTLSRRCISSGRKSTWGMERNNNCLSEMDVLNKIKNKTTKGKRLTGKDMQNFVESLDDIGKVAKINRTIAAHMLSTVGSLMNIDTRTLGEIDHLGVKSDKVKSIIEDLSSVLEIPNNRNSNVVSTEDIHVGAYELSQTNKPITVMVTGNFKSKERNATTDNCGLRVTISSYLLEKWKQQQNSRFQVIAYKNSKLFVDTKSLDNPMETSVVSVVVDKTIDLPTSEPVLTYQLPRQCNDMKSYTCVYWDKVERIWSTSGITLIDNEYGEKLCGTSHLSSFSILLDADATERLPGKHEKYLTYISYIGCALSIVGLVLTIVIYSLFKSLNSDDSGKIFLNICVSMLLLNVVFILGSLDSESYNLGICMAVGVALHYFLLTTLLWMMIEALNMYQMLVIVFRQRYRRYMQIRMLAGWGIPLTVVGITLSISPNNYKPSNEFCFLSQTNQIAFYAAVLAPACVILLVNCYVFIRIFALIMKSAKSGSSSTLSITQVRGAMSVMIVLGITWIFGPLAIGSAKVVFAYLFTILNSTQGFLVFIFRCVFNAETVRSVKLYISTGQFKKRRGSLPTITSSTKTLTIRTKALSTSTGESTDFDISSNSELSTDIIPDRSEKPCISDQKKIPLSTEKAIHKADTGSAGFVLRTDSMPKLQIMNSTMSIFSQKSAGRALRKNRNVKQGVTKQGDPDGKRTRTKSKFKSKITKPEKDSCSMKSFRQDYKSIHQSERDTISLRIDMIKDINSAELNNLNQKKAICERRRTIKDPLLLKITPEQCTGFSPTPKSSSRKGIRSLQTGSSRHFPDTSI